MGAQLNFVAKHGMMKRFLMLRKKLGLPRLSQKGMMQIMLFWTTNKFERVLCPLSSQQLLQDSHFSKISQITKESEACVPSYFLLGKRLHTPCFPVTCSGLRLGHAAWRSLCDALGSLGSVDGTAKRRNRYTALRMSPEDLQDQMVDGMKMDEFFFWTSLDFFGVGKGSITNAMWFHPFWSRLITSYPLRIECTSPRQLLASSASPKHVPGDVAEDSARLLLRVECRRTESQEAAVLVAWNLEAIG